MSAPRLKQMRSSFRRTAGFYCSHDYPLIYHPKWKTAVNSHRKNHFRSARNLSPESFSCEPIMTHSIYIGPRKKNVKRVRSINFNWTLKYRPYTSTSRFTFSTPFILSGPFGRAVFHDGSEELSGQVLDLSLQVVLIFPGWKWTQVRSCRSGISFYLFSRADEGLSTFTLFLSLKVSTLLIFYLFRELPDKKKNWRFIPTSSECTMQNHFDYFFCIHQSLYSWKIRYYFEIRTFNLIGLIHHVCNVKAWVKIENVSMVYQAWMVSRLSWV